MSTITSGLHAGLWFVSALAVVVPGLLILAGIAAGAWWLWDQPLARRRWRVRAWQLANRRRRAS